MSPATLSRACNSVVQALNQAPDRIGILLVRAQKGLVLAKKDRKTGKFTPVSGFIAYKDTTLAHGVARILDRESGISVPPHLISGASFTDLPGEYQGSPTRTRYWVILLQEDDSILHVTHGAHTTAWVRQDTLRDYFPLDVFALLPTFGDTPKPAPVPAKGSTKGSVREDLSLGEPVLQARACDIPPDIVLRPRADHAALLRGQLVPMTDAERTSSRALFPNAASLEAVGYQLRGNRVYALTEDDRTYPVETLPGGLVLSLSPRLIQAFGSFLRSDLPKEVRQWRDRTLDRIIADPQQIPTLRGTTEALAASGYRGGAEQALDQLLADRSDDLDRQIWHGLCYGPGGPTSPLREAWERADYGAMLAQVPPRETEGLGGLVRQMARLHGATPAPLAASGLGTVRVGLPTEMLLDVEAHEGAEMARWRAQYGRVQARQTILVLPEPDADALVALIQAHVPRWRMAAQVHGLNRNEQRTYQGWLERAQALVQEVPVGPTMTPGFAASYGGVLTEHQQTLVRGLIRRTWSSPELRGYVPDQAWREALPTGRTFVRFQSPEGRQVVLILPPEKGEATPMFAAIHPLEADTRLDVLALVREEQDRAGIVPQAGVSEALRIRGASPAEDAREFAFYTGLTASPVGMPEGEVNPAWQGALMQTHARLRQLGLPDLRPLLTPGGHTACGMFACAYVSDRLPNRVVKITGDPADAAAWANVQDLSLSVEALARTELVTSGEDPRVFILVQPFLYPLAPWERGFLRQPGMRYLLEHGVGSQRVCIEAVQAYAQKVAPPRGHSLAHLKRNLLLLREALRVLRARGVYLHDLHPGNVLRTKSGDWRLVDLGVSQSPPVDIPDWDPHEIQALVRSLTRQADLGRVERLPAAPESGLGSVPDDLYHGTTLRSLTGILQHGLLPRKTSGTASVHRTKTTTATFLTDEPAGALSYALAEGADRTHAVLLDIEPKGLTLRPDYDDTTMGVDNSLEEIGRVVREWTPKIGDPIPEHVVEDVISTLDSLREEGVDAPLDVQEGGDGVYRIVVDPVVRMPVAEEFSRLPELADFGPAGPCSAPDIQWDEGTPYFEIRQYQCLGPVPVKSIRRVWVDARATKGRGPFPVDAPTMCLGDPAVSPRLPSGEPWSEGDSEEDAEFFVVTLVGLTPEEALTWLAK